MFFNRIRKMRSNLNKLNRELRTVNSLEQLNIFLQKSANFVPSSSIGKSLLLVINRLNTRSTVFGRRRESICIWKSNKAEKIKIHASRPQIYIIAILNKKSLWGFILLLPKNFLSIFQKICKSDSFLNPHATD